MEQILLQSLSLRSRNTLALSSALEKKKLVSIYVCLFDSETHIFTCVICLSITFHWQPVDPDNEDDDVEIEADDFFDSSEDVPHRRKHEPLSKCMD